MLVFSGKSAQGAPGHVYEINIPFVKINITCSVFIKKIKEENFFM
jgi:hypothetical protein